MNSRGKTLFGSSSWTSWRWTTCRSRPGSTTVFSVAPSTTVQDMLSCAVAIPTSDRLRPADLPGHACADIADLSISDPLAGRNSITMRFRQASPGASIFLRDSATKAPGNWPYFDACRRPSALSPGRPRRRTLYRRRWYLRVGHVQHQYRSERPGLEQQVAIALAPAGLSKGSPLCTAKVGGEPDAHAARPSGQLCRRGIARSRYVSSCPTFDNLDGPHGGDVGAPHLRSWIVAPSIISAKASTPARRQNRSTLRWTASSSRPPAAA